MKKVILMMLTLLVVSFFLVGCSDNLAGEAYRSSRTNTDNLMTQIIEKETQICNEKNMRACPRANEDNVYALLARSNVFVTDLILNQQPRNLNSLKKTVNDHIGLLQKVSSGKGSSKDKLVAKAFIGQTYASADLETQADILIVADLIAANKLRVSPEDMASVDKMLGSDLLKGISKAGPDMDASTGGMGSLIPPGPSQSFFDCVQEALGSKSGGSSQQAPGGGASDPLMPVGPDGDFGSGSEGGMPSPGSDESFDFDIGFCEGIDQGMMPGFGTSVDGEGSELDELDDLEKGDVISYEYHGDTDFDVNGDGIKEPCTVVQNGEFEVVATKGEQGTVFDYTTSATLEWIFTDDAGTQKTVKKNFNQGFSKQNLKKQMGSVKFKVKKGVGSSSFDPEGNSGNIFGCPAVNAVEACMEAAGSADICTGIGGMGEQGQVAMVLQDFCNSATGAEIDTSLFDQSVIINPGNMINQAYLINFFGFTQAQLGDLYSKS